MKMARKVEKATGVVCLGVWIHKDEGHAKSRFNPDEPYQCNYHIHFLWDCQNPTTGKAIPLKRQDFRDMQDIAAESLGMERGTPVEQTGRKHIESMTFKVQQLLKEVKELKKERTGLLAKIADAWKYKGKSEELEKILENERKEHSEAVNALNEAHNKDIANLNTKMDGLTKRLDTAESWQNIYRKERDSAEKDNKLLKSKIDRLKDQITELTRGKEQEQNKGLGR